MWPKEPTLGKVELGVVMVPCAPRDRATAAAAAAEEAAGPVVTGGGRREAGDGKAEDECGGGGRCGLPRPAEGWLPGRWGRCGYGEGTRPPELEGKAPIASCTGLGVGSKVLCALF